MSNTFWPDVLQNLVVGLVTAGFLAVGQIIIFRVLRSYRLGREKTRFAAPTSKEAAKLQREIARKLDQRDRLTRYKQDFTAIFARVVMLAIAILALGSSIISIQLIWPFVTDNLSWAVPFRGNGFQITGGAIAFGVFAFLNYRIYAVVSPLAAFDKNLKRLTDEIESRKLKIERIAKEFGKLAEPQIKEAVAEEKAEEQQKVETVSPPVVRLEKQDRAVGVTRVDSTHSRPNDFTPRPLAPDSPWRIGEITRWGDLNFGFIRGDDDQEYFTHRNYFITSGDPTVGDRVIFLPAETQQKPAATLAAVLGDRAEGEITAVLDDYGFVSVSDYSGRKSSIIFFTDSNPGTRMGERVELAIANNRLGPIARNLRSPHQKRVA